MKLLCITFAFLALILFSGTSFASASLEDNQLILDVIEQLEGDNFISKEASELAKEKYGLDGVEREGLISKYVTWSNTAFLISTIFGLIFFSGIIKKVILSGILIILAIPEVLYQFSLLSITIMMALKPEWFSIENSMYVGFFGCFANIIIVGWFFNSYELVLKTIRDKIQDKIGIKLGSLYSLNMFLSCYFLFFTLFYESVFLGFFFVGTLNSLFLLIASSINKNKILEIMILFNSLVMFGYLGISSLSLSIPYMNYFMVGIMYIFTTSLCGLLFYKIIVGEGASRSLYIIVSLIICAMTFSVSSMYGIAVVSAITNTYMLLLVLYLIIYASKDFGLTKLMGILAIIFYGLGKLLQNYSEYFITNLF